MTHPTFVLVMNQQGARAGAAMGRLSALSHGRGEASRGGGLLHNRGRDHLLLLLRHGHGHHGDSGADGHSHADEATEGDDGERGVDVLGGRHRA